MQHLIDTPPRLSTCNRCKAYVLAGKSSGCEYVLDPEPLNSATALALRLSGVWVYRSHHGLISLVTASTLRHEGTRYKEHGCGCFVTPVEVVPSTPPQAPVTPEQGVLGGRGLKCSPVRSVTRLRSDDRATRCSDCGELIKEDEPRISVEMPQWQTNVHKVPNRGSRKGYTKTIEGWGVVRWTIHPDGCPVRTSG